MRVIAGQWRGRRLAGLAGPQVRPTTDRVKEALFNILAADVIDAQVLDVCCGSGGLGIEALSRGARHAVFVDEAATCLAAVRANLQACGAQPGSWTTVRADALAYLDRVRREPPAGPWLLLADPPYASALAELIMRRMPELAACAGFVAAAVEHDRRLCGPELAGPQAQTRLYGRTALTLVRP